MMRLNFSVMDGRSNLDYIVDRACTDLRSSLYISGINVHRTYEVISSVLVAFDDTSFQLRASESFQDVDSINTTTLLRDTVLELLTFL